MALIHLAMAGSIGVSDQTGSGRIFTWTAIMFGVFFFPLLPAAFYILLVICPKETSEDLRRYKERRELRVSYLDLDTFREMSCELTR